MDTTPSTDQVVRNWRDETFAQGRKLSWLAVQTNRSASTVYAYSRGLLRPPEPWLRDVAALLGATVTHVPQREDGAA